MPLPEAGNPERIPSTEGMPPEVIRRQFAESVRRIKPEEFDRDFHVIAKEFRAYLKELLDKMQSLKNGETIELTQTDREIISRILEKDPKARDMEELFEQFEEAHEIFGTTELQKDVDMYHRDIVSTMSILDRMLKGDKNIWELIQAEDGDLGHFAYGMLATWLSKHNEDLRLGH